MTIICYSIPINFHLYHYAGNNPIRYVDPDGRVDEYDISITKEQYENSNLQRQYTWEQVQQFFEENPNGVFQRWDDEFSFRAVSNKKDLVDPNACNFDLVILILGSKLISNLVSFGKTLSSFGSKKIPEGKWEIERPNGTKAEIHSGHTHYDRTTKVNEDPHTHELRLRDVRDPKSKTEPYYKDKEGHRTTDEEMKLFREQYPNAR